MRALNQLARRCVRRGMVTIYGALYYSVELEALHGAVLDFAVRPDGRAFAEFPAGQVELVRVV